MEVILGVDTSCYTTSLAALDPDGILVADFRIPLVVKPGGRGLSQSEMVFQHVRNLPLLMTQLRQSIGNEARISAVGTTVRPRSVEGSYMPVFLAGRGLALCLGEALSCSVFKLSHQENHVLAGLWSAGGISDPEFLAAHVSGGTTEILRATSTEEAIELELLGGSVDLHAGQFIDRVGVALGLPFPAGSHLERLAASYAADPPMTPISVEGTRISFSGPETHVMRWLGKQPEAAAVASSVQYCIAGSLIRALRCAAEQTGLNKVLLVGGVAANSFIRSRIADTLLKQCDISVVWPESRFSGDNAVGAACWALSRLAG